MIVGYNIDLDKIDINKDNLLQTILLDIAKDQINFLRQLLARILLGQTFEKFTILRGCGLNGKLSL